MNFLIHILIEISQIYIILLMLNECLENIILLNYDVNKNYRYQY